MYEFGKRINVVGTTGSGKTTLAKNLSKKFSYQRVELDALWWDANWTNPTVEVFRQRVEEAVSSDSWVVDGNYGAVRDIVWERVETIIWLDYPLWLILLQLFKRTVRRLTANEEIWNGNRERFVTAFLSKESLFVWAFQSYWRNKRRYSMLLAQNQHTHLQAIHLTSPRQTREFLSSLQ